MTVTDDLTMYKTLPVLHNTKNTYGTIPIKILATKFAVPSKFDKNDQLRSNSTPMVHKGAVLLAKNQVLLAKSEK